MMTTKRKTFKPGDLIITTDHVCEVTGRWDTELDTYVPLDEATTYPSCLESGTVAMVVATAINGLDGYCRILVGNKTMIISPYACVELLTKPT